MFDFVNNNFQNSLTDLYVSIQITGIVKDKELNTFNQRVADLSKSLILLHDHIRTLHTYSYSLGTLNILENDLWDKLPIGDIFELLGNRWIYGYYYNNDINVLKNVLRLPLIGINIVGSDETFTKALFECVKKNSVSKAIVHLFIISHLSILIKSVHEKNFKSILLKRYNIFDNDETQTIYSTLSNLLNKEDSQQLKTLLLGKTTTETALNVHSYIMARYILSRHLIFIEIVQFALVLGLSKVGDKSYMFDPQKYVSNLNYEFASNPDVDNMILDDILTNASFNQFDSFGHTASIFEKYRRCSDSSNIQSDQYVINSYISILQPIIIPLVMGMMASLTSLHHNGLLSHISYLLDDSLTFITIPNEVTDELINILK